MSPDPHPADREQPKASSPLGSVIKTALKLGVAVGLLAWLFYTGDLDPEVLKLPLEVPGTLAVIVCMGALCISLSGLRWWLLLGAEGITIPVLTAIRLTWIGHFWNQVIPGAVSGDLVKMFYVGRLVPERREESWTTVVADRLIGLCGLVSLSTVVALSRLELVMARTELRVAFAFMVCVLAGFIAAVVVLALGMGTTWRITAWARGRAPKAAESMSRFYRTFRRLLTKPGRLLAAFAISVFAHCMTVGYAALFGSLFTDAFEVSEYFALVPIALFSNAIPLSPGGIGIGEKVLAQLLTWAGASGSAAPASLAKAGVSIMIWMRLVFYSLAIVGGVLYAVYRQPADFVKTPDGPSRD